MTERIRIQNLLRLTLTRKGRAIAKHPLLREGVIEAIKAESVEEDPLWEAPRSGSFQPDDADDAEDADWYGDFAAHIANVAESDIPEDWVTSFTTLQTADQTTEKATKKPNYPASRGPFAGPHNSFPIKSQQDVYDAARLVGHAANPAAVKQRIIRIAHSKGFALPKSWTKGVTAKKSLEEPMDEAQFEELVTRLTERLSSVAPEAPVSTSVVAPVAAVMTKTLETPEVTKAKASLHSHEHNHSTQRGYGYSHTHDHTHSSMDDHETSEAAHGHDHISKASDAVSVAVSAEELQADIAGLDTDLKASKARIAELEASLQQKETELAEKATTAEKAIADADAVKAELARAEAAAKTPLIAASAQTTEKAKVDPKSLPFDEAFHALLHS